MYFLVSALSIGKHGIKVVNPDFLDAAVATGTIGMAFFVGIQSYFMRKSIDEMKNERLFMELKAAIGFVSTLESITFEHNQKLLNQGYWTGFRVAPESERTILGALGAKNNSALSIFGSAYLSSLIVKNSLKSYNIDLDKYNEKIENLSKLNQELSTILSNNKCAQKFQNIINTWLKQNNGVGVPPLQNIIKTYVNEGTKGIEKYNPPQNIKLMLHTAFDDCIKSNADLKKIIDDRFKLREDIELTTITILNKLPKIKEELGARLI